MTWQSTVAGGLALLGPALRLAGSVPAAQGQAGEQPEREEGRAVNAARRVAWDSACFALAAAAAVRGLAASWPITAPALCLTPATSAERCPVGSPGMPDSRWENWAPGALAAGSRS
jgi:hypothetical protein